mgnify:CR=1 FL=1
MQQGVVMEKWTEIRTAYRLAKLGTLAATAIELGIHRSTVMRHIDALEASLQLKLFQRNDKGYIATEAGLEIMRLGEITDIQFGQFAKRAKNKEEVLEGTLTITCVNELSQLLFPTIAEYQRLYPNVSVDIIGDTRKFNLEYGEADIAIRTGVKPETLDNIVMSFADIELTLCVHQKYISRFGLPTKENLSEHKFLALAERLEHLPWNEWIYHHISSHNIVVTSSTQQVLSYALHNGCGIGVNAKSFVESHDELVEIAMDENWQVLTWLLVHRDIINIPKVRKFIDLLKVHKSISPEPLFFNTL